MNNSNKKFDLPIGSYAQVFHGTAKKTSGGLMRKDLMQTSDKRIVSRKKHDLGKALYKKNPQVLDANRAAPFQ